MDVSRRKALKIAITGTASFVAMQGLADALPQLAGKGQLTTVEDDASWLRRDLLEGCLGESFTVRTRTGVLSLKLVSVDDTAAARRSGIAGDEHTFIAVFRGPAYGKLPQGTYPFESRQLGGFDLFLVPGLTDARGTIYTATFNRLA
jgi:hypothetical protein